MRRMRKIANLCVWLGALLVVGCGSSHSAGSGGSGGVTGGGTGATGGAAGTAVGGTGIDLALGGGGVSDNTPRPGCSTDRHHVIGSQGEIVETCPSDQACENSACVPACAAFAAVASSVGCDFLAATPSVMSLYRPGCFAVFVANAWNRATRVRVERDGQSFDASAIGRIVGSGSDVTAWAPVPQEGLAPEQVAVLFLSHDPMGNSGDGTDTRCRLRRPSPTSEVQPYSRRPWTHPSSTPPSRQGAAWRSTSRPTVP